MIPTIIFIGYFLWALVLCPINDCAKVEKAIPEVECQCRILVREEGYDYPMEGNAYIEYGNNVIVIEGTVFKSLFKKGNQVRRDITMYRTRIPWNAPVPHLKINFSGNRVLSLYFET